MTSARHIDIHIVQSIPYANLNRDDLGQPKSVTYGGVNRTRVSSQSWKRATRISVEAAIGQRAVRTRRLVEAVSRKLIALDWPKDLADAAGRQVLTTITADLKKKTGLTPDAEDSISALLYLPEPAIDALVALCVEHRDAVEKEAGKKKQVPALPPDRVKEVFESRNGILNLFGRMLAELPGTNIDGSVQVAHAFTTHETSAEVDFFTAVDDINNDWDDATGSGHMNSAEYSAGVFYRFASIDLGDLAKNTGDVAVTRELAEAFLGAFISSLPEGKKTSTAAWTVPDLVYVTVRADRPLSMAAAFEAPVRSRSGWSKPSCRALADYAVKVHRLTGSGSLLHEAHAGIAEEPYESLGDRSVGFSELISAAVDFACPQAEKLP